MNSPQLSLLSSPFHLIVLLVIQQCVDCAVPLGGNCTVNAYCGVEAICDQNGQCICPLGYQQSPKSDYNCEQFICDDDYQCDSAFGKNTHCIGSGCFCQEGYELDINSTACAAASQLIGGQCGADSDCGNEAVCLQGTCKCKFGKTVTDNGQDCELLVCSTDAECKKMDNNSHCTGLHCICDSGRYLDVNSQICSKSNTKYIYIVGFVIEVIAILLVY